jgi:uncharacterized protein YjiS (DUF1127 family)
MKEMSTIDTICAVEATPATGVLPARSFFGGMVWRLSLWLRKRETRRNLRDLTDDQLRDIGLTRSEAMAEVSKSFFWD